MKYKVLMMFLINCYGLLKTEGQAITAAKKDSLILAKIEVLLSQSDSIQTHNRNAVLLIQKRNNDSIFNSNDKSYKFDSAHFKINKGRLIGTYFYLKDTSKKRTCSIFLNKAKIPITSQNIISKIATYKLQNIIDTSERINLTNYFLLYPNLNMKGNDYFPSDTIISFKKNNVEYVKKNYASKAKLENYFEVDILSDIQGLNNNNPNGLVQIEGRASLTLNRQFLCNTNLRFLYNIIPFIQFNKIEDNNRNLPILTDTLNNANQKNVNTINLWQYSNLTFGTKLNLIRWDSNNARHSLFIDISTMIIRTSLVDSLPKLTSKNVYSFIWGAAFKFRTIPINNIPFWADFSIGLNSLTLLDPKIKQQSNNMYQQNESTLISGRKNTFWDKFLMVPRIELYLKSADTKYFVRGAFPTDLTKTGNSFLQIQFGVSISPQKLNDYLKKN